MKSLLMGVILLSTILSTDTVWGQKKDPRLPYATNLRNTLIRSLRKPDFKNPFKEKCDAKAVFKRLPVNRMIPSKKDLIPILQQIADTLKLEGMKGEYFEREIYYAASSKKLPDFLSKIMGEDVNRKRLKDFRKKLTDYYLRIKRFKKKGIDLRPVTFTQRTCSLTIEHNIKPVFWDWVLKSHKYSTLINEWEVTTRITAACGCAPPLEHNVKSAIFENKSKLNGSFRIATNKVLKEGGKDDYILKFNNEDKSKMRVLELHCCPSKNPKKENSSLGPEVPENISLPNQTIGGFIGAGFQQNFDETTFCIGAEYLKNITQIGKSPLMVGGGVHYQTTSFFEVNTNGLALGPTAQLFTPITSSGSVYLVNGVSAQYAFGSQDAFGFESNFSGFSGLLNTGVHVPINDQLGVSLVVPVLSVQNTTFKPEGGEGTFTESNTGVFLENRNAIKVGLRFGF